MQLKKIDKARYRQHLNRIIISCIIAFAGLSLLISTIAIQLFTDGEGTHFWFNVAGVVMGMLIVGATLKRLQHHDYFTEVKYVWDVKQVLNLITRKQRKIMAAVDNDEANALLITLFSYQASKQVYELDDNVITLSELNKKTDALKDKIQALNLSIKVEQFDIKLLEQY